MPYLDRTGPEGTGYECETKYEKYDRPRFGQLLKQIFDPQYFKRDNTEKKPRPTRLELIASKA